MKKTGKARNKELETGTPGPSPQEEAQLAPHMGSKKGVGGRLLPVGGTKVITDHKVGVKGRKEKPW